MRLPPLLILERRPACPVDRRFMTAALAGALAFAAYGLAGAGPDLGDAPLFALVVPLTLGSIAYGVRGGVGFGFLAAGLACLWWLQHDQSGGAAWIVSRTVTCVLVGALLGWFVDSRNALVRQIAHHRELSLDLIATASFDGYFTDVNPAFTRILGYTADELCAKPFLDFVHPDDRDATLAAAAEQTEAGHEVVDFTNRYRAKDGSYRWLEWTSRPDPQAHELVAVARDITDRKLLQERERRHQEQLEHAVVERTRELVEARQETVQRLALAAEYRDDETRGHTARVGETAALIAAELGLDESMVELIREAALLHDVGKVGVIDSVLLKPGRLTPDEFEHVKQHAEIGASILAGSTSEVLMIAEEIARSHHEWWDGSGYPLGLQGDGIPLTARIVAVADVFDALTHTRPYKEASPVSEAVAEIHRLSGRQFDPAIVQAFAALNPDELAGIDLGRLAPTATRKRPQPAVTATLATAR